jgi:hypothetical protein
LMSLTSYLRRIRFALAVLLVTTSLFGHGSPSSAQTASLLEITAPADDSIVNPGQTVTISVASPANATFNGIVVVAGGHIGMSDVATVLPAQLSITIPPKTSSQAYPFVATGTTSSGVRVSAEIRLFVERADPPYALHSKVRQVLFDAQGDEAYLRIDGNFTDGNVADVTESLYVSYASSNPDIATVDTAGLVRAISPGTSVVTAMYGPPEQGIRVAIPVRVPTPPFALVPALLDFGEQAVSTSTSREMVLTNTTAGPLKISTVTTSGDFAAADTCVAASPISANATCIITVAFTPIGTGQRVGTVSIANGRNVVPVIFRVTGIGIAP